MRRCISGSCDGHRPSPSYVGVSPVWVRVRLRAKGAVGAGASVVPWPALWAQVLTTGRHLNAECRVQHHGPQAAPREQGALLLRCLGVCLTAWAS